MATQYFFDGQTRTEPGVYSTIKSGNTRGLVNASYNNICIIDTGSAAGFGGAGVNGAYVNGKKAIYSFDTVDEFKTFIRGGLWYSLADYLGTPSNTSRNSIGKIYFISAKTSEYADTTIEFADLISPNGGIFDIATLAEGTGVNGVINTGKITRGFGWKIESGRIDPNKYVLKFYQGSFRGLDENGIPYNGIEEANSIPLLIAQSIEFNNVETLRNWMLNDLKFNSYFRLVSYTKNGNGSVLDSDFITLITDNLFAGGSESYSPTDLDEVLERIQELDNSFFLSDKWGVNANSTENFKILSHIKNSSLFQKILFIGGGRDKNSFNSNSNSSIQVAQAFDSDSVVVVHSGIKKLDVTSSRVKDQDSIYTAAMVLGRIAGLEPQSPGTFKDLNILGVEDELGEKQRVQALQSGVLHIRNVDGFWVINQAINTLQENTTMTVLQENNLTHDIGLKRIAMQLNKELVLNMRNPVTGLIGKNFAQLDPVDVVTFVEGYLKNKTATKVQDNLILSFKNINVRTVNGDSYEIKYEFVPNGPINKIFITGFMLDVNLSA